jgi:hypothetical protein
MIQRLLAFLLILYISAVVFAPPITESGWLRIDDIILVCAASLSILSRLRSRNRSNSSIVLAISIFVYLILLIMLLSTFMAGFNSHFEYDGVIKELLRLGKYLLVVFLALSIQEKKYRRFVIFWVFGLAIMVVVTQIGQYGGGMRFNRMFAQFYGGHQQYGVALNPLSRELGFFHAGGPFGNPNVASSFLIIPFVLSFYYVVRGFEDNPGTDGNTRKERIFSAIVTFMVFIGILLTDSRAAVVTIPVIMLFFLYVSGSNKGRIVSLMAVVAPLMILLLVAPFITNTGPIFDRITEGVEDGGSLAIKMTAFRNGVQQMSDSHYWWGFGAGTGPHVDFEFAQFVIWYGLPGLIVYLLFWISMMVAIIKSKEQFSDWPALVAIIIAFFLVNFSQSTFLNARVFPIFIVIFLMNANREYRMDGCQEPQVSPSPNSLTKIA